MCELLMEYFDDQEGLSLRIIGLPHLPYEAGLCRSSPKIGVPFLGAPLFQEITVYPYITPV